MSKFKPTHVYDGNDVDCFFTKGDKVKFVEECSYDYKQAHFETEAGYRQQVNKSCMTLIVESL